MAILTTSGRTALAQAIYAQALHLAWGTGDAGWDTTPVAEPVGATALVAEVGRRVVTQKQYVVSDVNGSISVPTGRYEVSVNPTNLLYLRFQFDYADAPAAVIREVGVFTGTVIAGGVPGGQQYFAPADVSNGGTLLALQRIAKITRSAATRNEFEFVLTF